MNKKKILNIRRNLAKSMHKIWEIRFSRCLRRYTGIVSSWCRVEILPRLRIMWYQSSSVVSFLVFEKCKMQKRAKKQKIKFLNKKMSNISVKKWTSWGCSIFETIRWGFESILIAIWYLISMYFPSGINFIRKLDRHMVLKIDGFFSENFHFHCVILKTWFSMFFNRRVVNFLHIF
jgi:hypothetical protein